MTSINVLDPANFLIDTINFLVVYVRPRRVSASGGEAKSGNTETLQSPIGLGLKLAPSSARSGEALHSCSSL